jgi:hypothetical protein
MISESVFFCFSYALGIGTALCFIKGYLYNQNEERIVCKFVALEKEYKEVMSIYSTTIARYEIEMDMNELAGRDSMFFWSDFFIEAIRGNISGKYKCIMN